MKTKRKSAGLPADHKLLLRALITGRARWEAFAGSATSAGEVCVGGFRWATFLDPDGIPILHDNLRRELARAIDGRGARL